MAFESSGQTGSSANSLFAIPPERLSQSGQMIGWGVYGSLVVIGFIFGIVTGYERPRTITVAKVTKEKDNSKPDTPKPDKPTPKVTPTPEPPPPTAPTQPVSTPSTETLTPTPTPTPMVTTPSPKDDPKPPMPMVTTPPKVDTPPKKDLIKAVSFKTEVLPILRTHCLNCHGAVGKPKGDVDLTTFAKLMKSQSPGKIVVPGKPEESDIYTSITERDMPSGGKPKPNEKDLLVLKNWILSGAKERRRPIRGRNRVRTSRA